MGGLNHLLSGKKFKIKPQKGVSHTKLLQLV